jgi:PKD repeat protein
MIGTLLKNLPLKTGFLLLLFICMNTHLYSQNASFTLPDVVCQNEEIAPDVTNVSGDSFYWDFCEGDFLQDLGNASSVVSLGALGIDGIDIIEHNGLYFGFVLSRSLNKLFRLEFGANPESTPIVNDMGNPLNLLNLPSKIEMIKTEGTWRAVISNTDNTSNLILYEFAPDLSSISNGRSLGNFGEIQFGFGLTHLVMEDAVTLFVTNRSRREIVEVSFSLDFSSALSTRKFAIPNSGFIRATTFIKYNESILGLTVAESGTAFLITFETPSAFPQFLEVNTEVELNGVIIDATLFKEKGKILASVISNIGNVYRFDFGVNASIFPSVDFLGGYNLPPVAYVSQAFVRYESKTRFFITDARVSRLVGLTFENTCDGNISYSNQMSPSVNYSASGKKYISLTAKNTSGSQSYTVDSLLVNRGPSVDFSILGQCAGEGTSFTNEASSDVSINTVNWDFGDGTESSVSDPVHVFSTPGDYQVELSVTDDCGITQNFSKTITIFDNDDLQADFSSPTLLCTNTLVQFTDESVGQQDQAEGWEWLVEGEIVSTEQNLQISFDSPGIYQLTLNVTGLSGCTSSITKPINVIEGPDPSFTVDDACQGTLMQFNNTSTGQVSSFLWDFGNGVSSTLENPAIEFDQDGQYQVSLTLTNAAGCISSYMQSVTVYAQPEVAFSNELACERTPTLFRDESLATGANIVAWEWDFGDPSAESNSSTEKEPSHTFSGPGTYTVTLTATSNFGCVSTASGEVSVLPAPTAAFSYNQACVGEAVQFQDNSFPPSGASLTSWAWDLGGQFSSQRNPTATFNFPLTYDVTLTVTASNQCISTYTEQVVVPAVPEMDFGIEQPCLGAPVTFYDLTESPADPVVSRSWDFAGLGLDSDSVATFTFPNTGNFMVTLSVTVASGCTYEYSRSIFIDNPPVASFELENDFGAPPFALVVENTSQRSTTYEWLLDEVSISTQQDLQYTINEAGNYQLTLIASNATGCSDVATRMIQVTDPVIDLSLSDLSMSSDNGFIQLSFTVRNEGSINLERFPVIISLEDGFELYQEIEQALPADNSPVNIILPLQINERSPLNVCVEIPSEIQGVTDGNPDNNAQCIADSGVIIYAPYPNPASDVVYLEILSAEDELVTIDVFTTNGVHKNSATFSTRRSGIYPWELNTSDLAAGAYVIRAVSRTGTQYYRLVIQR